MTMLTPWMKWMPLYRYGTVTAVDVDANTINVELEPILSKTFVWLRRDLTINDPWQSQMTGVWVNIPCGAKLFAIGDEAVVVYSTNEDKEDMPPSWSCIWFKHSPKDCEVDEYDPYDGINPGGADGDFQESVEVRGRQLAGYGASEYIYNPSFSGEIDTPEGLTITGSGTAICQTTVTSSYSVSITCAPVVSQVLVTDDLIPIEWPASNYRVLSEYPFTMIAGVGDPDEYPINDQSISLAWESYNINDSDGEVTHHITNASRQYILEPDPPCGGSYETATAWSGTFYMRKISSNEYWAVLNTPIELPNITIAMKNSNAYRIYKAQGMHPERPFRILYTRINYP
jgi:hypothetical protein